MPQRQSNPPFPRLQAIVFVAAALNLPVAAHAADPEVDLSADALTLGAPAGAPVSQVMVALDHPIGQSSAAVAEMAGGIDPAAVDPAIARPGDILQAGIASWYGGRRWAGHRTASGTRYNPEAMTAASHTLPLGTRVLVTLEGTARSVLVTITDHQGTARRIIDLSKAAARKLGLLGRGTGRVVLTRA